MTADFEAKAKAAEEKAAAYKKRIDDATIDRALEKAGRDAGAYEWRQLRPMLGRVVVRDGDKGEYVAVIDDSGNARSVGDAIAALKSDPAYVNLFTDTMSGATAAKPAPAKPADKPDLAKLTHEQYRKLRAENPAALGLRPRGSRR